MANEDIQTESENDPEPEGVVDVDVAAAGVKQKMVPVSALPAERSRIRKVEREKQAALQRELDAERQKTQQVRADLEAVRPHIVELQKQHQKAGETPEMQAITDEEATAYARDYELFTASGLDVARAKRMIARENKKVSEASSRAAQDAVRPLAQSSAQNQSMAFLAWAKNQRGHDGAPLADPGILEAAWAEVPAELTADPRVAQERLKYAIGETLLQGKRPAAPMQREPMFTEAPGGFRERVYEMTPMERTIQQNHGISEKDWTETAKRYVPGRTNRLGE